MLQIISSEVRFLEMAHFLLGFLEMLHLLSSEVSRVAALPSSEVTSDAARPFF